MHGAESDVQWLQRDYGIYVVNLFDTYYAAKFLKLGKFDYAHLLTSYVGIVPDKSHQLADWR
jgi:exosome complex exonuclease RRP6